MNDTVIFIVLAGLALLFKWLTKQGSSDEETPQSPPPNEPSRRAPPLSEEERVRRFLEALGAPAGTKPPPPVRPRTFTPRPVVTPSSRPPPTNKRSWAQPLPPVITTPEEIPLPPLTTTPTSAPAFVVETQPLPEAAAPPLLPPSVAARPLTSKAAAGRALPMTSLRPLLRSREKIRQAIILREVLGPPRGLEPFGQFQGQ